MSQSRQQQQQQQHSNSDSNFNVAQPQSEPCREELEALSETDIDTWLATLPGPEECDISFAVELQILLATQPDNTDTQQQATTMWIPALPCPQECHTLLAEANATQPDTNTNTNTQPALSNPADLVYVTDTQQPTTVSTPALPGPQQCHTSSPEDLHTATDTQQEATTATVWTRLQDKAFENALVTCPEGIENRWERIAALVPGGKTPAEVSIRYEQLLHDISLIQSGWVELPIYKDDLTKVDGGTTKRTPPGNGNGKKCRWTEEEHKLFLIGLKQFEKGEWMNIARHCVKTKTTSQVSSHAQKYFQHQSDTGNKRRRKSIYDITIENNDLVPRVHHHPYSQSQP